jgi:hypothetical protein
VGLSKDIELKEARRHEARREFAGALPFVHGRIDAFLQEPRAAKITGTLASTASASCGCEVTGISIGGKQRGDG